MPLGAYANWCTAMGTSDACPQGVHALGIVDCCARDGRPGDSRIAEKDNELPPLHLMRASPIS